MRMLASILFGILAIIFLVVSFFALLVMDSQQSFILGMLVAATFACWPLVDLFQHFTKYCEEEIATSHLAHSSE